MQAESVQQCRIHKLLTSIMWIKIIFVIMMPSNVVDQFKWEFKAKMHIRNSSPKNKNVLTLRPFFIRTDHAASHFIRCWIDGLQGVSWIIVMFYQLFGLSLWRHPFTTEDPLVSKWCNATFLQICSDEETNSTHLGWPEGEYFSANANFCVDYSFNLHS